MKYLLTLTGLLLANIMFAQTHNIRGKVVDEKGQGMPGATLKLERDSNTLVRGAVSNAEGRFLLNGIEKGSYTLKISILGYEELSRPIQVDTQDVRLGPVQMTLNAQLLDQVEIKSQMVTAVQKGDTSEFNAGAFKVMKDANAEDLIQKMPGVTVENGQMKAHGENVQQVLVDGKPFFGNDPNAAMKNLPAELIEKVQVFDAQTDQAQFTGFSDGTTTKTINIVTKSGMQNGQFGKLYAGYGYEDKYQVGGNLSYFDGDRRVSLIGMTNNINVQNFAAEDILGAMAGGGSRGGGGGRGGGRGGQGGGGQAGDFLVGSSGGITTTYAFGVNYSDKWGKKTDVSGSYFFNKGTTESDKITNRQFLNDQNVADEVYDETSNSSSDNINHRANLRVEFKIDSMNSIMLRPRLTFQQNGGNASTIGQTAASSALLNATTNNYLSDFDGVNFSNSLLWRHKFQKKGRTVSLDFTSGYAPKKGESTLQSINEFYNTPQPKVDSLDQRTRLSTNNWNVAGNLEYTEPLGENAQLLMNYRHSYQQEESDRRLYDWAESTGGYDILNEPLSNVFSNDYQTEQGGLGYNYTKGRDFNLSARVNTQWASLMNDQTFPQKTEVNNRFFNVLPSANLRYNFDKNRNIRFNYRASTQLPSVDQLQNVVNNSNPLLLTAGNPELNQSEQHNVFVRYQAANPAKSTSFFLMGGGSFVSDYIGKSTFLASSDNPIFGDLDVQPGAQLTIPVNLNGYRTARSFGSYGMPIKWIKSNLNFDVSYNYSRMPGLINEALNYASTHSFGAGITLSSNVSEKLDFSVSTRPIWNKSNNTLQTAANTEYLTQNSRVKLNWQIIEGFVLRTDMTHTLYSGLSEGFDQNYVLWNLAVGKKIFKNQRGEIALAINDLLNQNRNVNRTITESYIEDTRTNALTRFVMLSFTYNLRNFNTGKAATNPSPERRMPPDGGMRRPMEGGKGF